MRVILWNECATLVRCRNQSPPSYSKLQWRLAIHMLVLARRWAQDAARKRLAATSYIGRARITTSAPSCIATMKASLGGNQVATSTIELVTLAAGELRATIAPQAGGSIASFTRAWREGAKHRELHWLRPASATGLAARNPLEMASFPLVPFCNRIRNGRASFEGRDIRMPPNHPGEESPHPLHGIGWLREWTVVSASPTEALLSLDVAASAAWPWRFSARQRYTLAATELRVSLALRNEDTAAMPAGIGHHPYFPHHRGTRITSPTEAMWTTDAQVMPVTLEETPAVLSLRHGVELSQLDLDNNFTGWQRRTIIEWPADVRGPARRMTLSAERPLDFFVLYCPRGYEYFCAEPVSQCTDWLNSAGAWGPDAIGGARIEPGGELTAQFTLQPHA